MKKALLALVVALGLLSPTVIAVASGGGAPEPVNLYELHYGKDAHGGELEPGEHPMGPALAFFLLNFFIFAGVLVWKVGPVIRRHLTSKHNEIKEQLAEAGRLREAAKKKLEEYRRKVENADREIAALVADIRGAASAERDRLIKQAQEQAESMRRDTADRIEAEMARARAEIEREVVAQAIERAKALLAKNATAEDHAQLLSTFVGELHKHQKETRV